MPKGIGYQEASKLSAFKRKKSKEEAIKKADKRARGRVTKGGKEF